MIDIVTGADAQQNVAGLPANVLLYGGPGLGKTTDAVATFCVGNRCNAFVIPCEDGALKAPAARGLPVPDHPREPVKSWPQMCEAIGWLNQNRSRYTGLIIDGFSVFSTYLYKAAQSEVKSSNKYDIPLLVRSQLLTLRGWLRALGLHSVLIAHPIQPGFQEGVFYQGGFSLSPKSLIGEYFGQTDTVLRVDYVTPPAVVGGPPPPPSRVYFTGGTDWPASFVQPPDWRWWRTKNREGCNSAIVDADLGRFLRARQPPYGGL